MKGKSPEFIETDLHGLQFDVEALADEMISNKCDTIAKIITWIFSKNALGEGKSRWGDKTPYYVLHIPKILEWWPDAQIIHIIRDGRDVALSVLERKHDFFIYNYYVAAKEWCKYVEKGKQFGNGLRSDQYLEIKYEDLLASPRAKMKQICTFLGEEYTDELFATSQTDNPGKTPLVHEQIKQDNFEKWRSKMSTRQLRVFEGVAKQTLLNSGYGITTDAKPISTIKKIFYLAHNNLLEHYWRRKLKTPKTKNFAIK